MRSRSQGLRAALILLASLAAYGAHLDDYFIKDDLSLQILTGGGHEFDARSWFTQLIWPTERELDDIFRPIPPLLWATEYLTFGPDPIPFHLGNLLAHALNGLLIFGLVSRWTRREDAAFSAGILFVLYPLHGEAVLWSTQRFVVLGLTFFLLSLLAYDAYLHRRNRSTFLLTLAAFAAATLTKELGIVLPGLLALQALVLGPPRRFRSRLKDGVVIALVGAAWLSVYFGMRIAIFGRPLGSGYAGWPSLADYARDNRVYERLPDTLLALATPINRSIFGETAVAWFVGLAAVLGGLAFAGSVHLATRSHRDRGFLAFAGAFTLLVYFPTAPILFIDADLLNSRFGYHLLAMVVPLVAVGLHAVPGEIGRRVGRFASGMAMLAFALVLHGNLGAYERGAATVRELQEFSCKAARDGGPGTGLVIFDVPAVQEGCPTIDAYLPVLLRPPLTTRPVPAVAFVPGTPWYRQVATDGSVFRPEQLVTRVEFYLVVTASPLVVSPLFGAPESEVGPEAARLLSPADNIVLLAPGPEPNFVFEAPPARRQFRLHLLHGRGAEGHLEYVIEIGGNATQEADRVRWKLSDGDRLGRAPNPWPLLRGASFRPPTAVQWRVETLGADGRTTGWSRSRNLVVLRSDED